MKLNYYSMLMIQQRSSRTLAQRKLSSVTLLDDFQKISGLAVNPTKTKGMWIGSLRENKSTPFGIKCTIEPVKALGVYYSYDQKLLHEKNFIERLDSVKKLINIWSARDLSLYGRITVIKSLIIPKFVYIASSLTSPRG